MVEAGERRLALPIETPVRAPMVPGTVAAGAVGARALPTRIQVATLTALVVVVAHVTAAAVRLPLRAARRTVTVGRTPTAAVMAARVARTVTADRTPTAADTARAEADAMVVPSSPARRWRGVQDRDRDAFDRLGRRAYVRVDAVSH